MDAWKHSSCMCWNLRWQRMFLPVNLFFKMVDVISTVGGGENRLHSNPLPFLNLLKHLIH